MTAVVRVIGLSLVTAAFGAGLGVFFFGQHGYSECIIPVFFLACVGAIVGAIAGAAQGVVNAMAGKPAKAGGRLDEV